MKMTDIFKKKQEEIIENTEVETNENTDILENEQVEEVVKETSEEIEYVALQTVRNDLDEEIKVNEEVTNISNSRLQLLLEYKLIERIDK